MTQRIGRDPFHKANHHRKAGPMTSKTRPLTEQEAIDEQMEPMTATKVHEQLQGLVEELKTTCKVRQSEEEKEDPILERDVKKLRRRLFTQSDRIRDLEQAGREARAKLATSQQVAKECQDRYDSLLQSALAVVEALKSQGYYDKKGDTE